MQRAPELAQLFRKQEIIKTYEKKLENNKLSLHINSSGTVFDNEIPCVKACFFFDPKHKLETVIKSVSQQSKLLQK